MVISSKDNKTVKLVHKLSSKKFRDETGLFVVEGLRAVKDVAAFAPQLIEQIFVSEERQADFPEAAVVRADIFARMTETVNGQGILAVVKKPTPVPPSGDRVLILDGIRDPGNLGTLIRTACAAGYGDVVLRNCADPYGGKVVRSTMSAVVKVCLTEIADTSLIDELKTRGYAVFGADMGGKSVFDGKFSANKYAVVIGGEADGITNEVKEMCDEMLSLPMDGDIESLNAAVSGAIMMYILKYNK